MNGAMGPSARKLHCNGEAGTQERMEPLARIIHEGSSPFDKLRVPSPAEGRKRADVKRNGHSEA